MTGPASRDLPVPRPPAEGGQERRFRIDARYLPYQPGERAIPPELAERRGLIDRTTGSRHWLYLLGEAAAELERHIGWGRETDDNTVEQGGLLFGHVYRDPERREVYGVVLDVRPAFGANASTTFLEMTPRVWADMVERYESDETAEAGDLQVIGWYHTHPNHLQIYMSGTDRGTQARFFDRDWHFAVVLNPQRREARAFHGENAEPCNLRIDPDGRLPEGLTGPTAGTVAETAGRPPRPTAPGEAYRPVPDAVRGGSDRRAAARARGRLHRFGDRVAAFLRPPADEPAVVGIPLDTLRLSVVGDYRRDRVILRLEVEIERRELAALTDPRRSR